MSSTHVLVKELNLTRYVPPISPISVADRMNAVPGFKTSAAFVTFLRANLVLDESSLDSNISTPLLYPSSSLTLPPLLSCSVAAMSLSSGNEVATSTNPLDSIPPLTTKLLDTETDKVAALKLVADSIAQQRQFASRSVIFHPISIAAWVIVLGIMSKLLYKSSTDLALLLTTSAGITMAFLVAIRGLTSGYIHFAEEMTWDYLWSGSGYKDIVIGSIYGEAIIGALILRLEPNGAGNNKKKVKSAKTGGKGIVRAWTTQMKYRGTGVGTELLEEAVRVTREKLGSSAEIGFAAEHANSKMILPEIFNGGFRKREARAAKALQSVVDSMEPVTRRRRKSSL